MDFAKSWRFERSGVPGQFADSDSPFVRLFRIHADADVVVRVVLEIRARMTGRAVGFSEEQFAASLSRF